MNTHPTHTRVWVGWGLWPWIVPIGVDVFFLFALFPPHLADGCVFLVHLCVFRAFFGVLVCVWKVFFALSNIVNYRKKFIFIYKLRLQKRQPNPGRKST